MYAVSLARTQRITTRVGTFSIHHLAPEVFGGFEEMPAGTKLATAEIRRWVARIPSARSRSVTERKLEAFLPRALG